MVAAVPVNARALQFGIKARGRRVREKIHGLRQRVINAWVFSFSRVDTSQEKFRWNSVCYALSYILQNADKLPRRQWKASSGIQCYFRVSGKCRVTEWDEIIVSYDSLLCLELQTLQMEFQNSVGCLV
jgi:hypothetical protein